MSTSLAKKEGGPLGRKQSVMPDPTARKQSMIPPDARRPSVLPSTLDPQHGATGRRASVMMMDHPRRPSQDRKQSIVESTTGRSTMIMTSAHTHRPNVRYENTYKTEPDVKFRSFDVRNAIKEIFERELGTMKYDKEKCISLTTTLSEKIKHSVKILGFPRYKIVVVVAIGQQETHPSIAFTSRCIWNQGTDNFSEYTFNNASLYAVGLVYAMYMD
ncbi:dynein light chain Tctex-type 5-like [Ostrea edulis]|uniref:dynein light chain Tctex-type 5-like n=1 Tax=Ostrea edulis TaxID=37623 RepID=UPI002094715A|nr:dynein light chain Tctex-type 5-like [Ostrea edulis]